MKNLLRFNEGWFNSKPKYDIEKDPNIWKALPKRTDYHKDDFRRHSDEIHYYRIIKRTYGDNKIKFVVQYTTPFFKSKNEYVWHDVYDALFDIYDEAVEFIKNTVEKAKSYNTKSEEILPKRNFIK